jgi:hypothetical protein
MALLYCKRRALSILELYPTIDNPETLLFWSKLLFAKQFQILGIYLTDQEKLDLYAASQQLCIFERKIK